MAEQIEKKRTTNYSSFKVKMSRFIKQHTASNYVLRYVRMEEDTLNLNQTTKQSQLISILRRIRLESLENRFTSLESNVIHI